MGIKKVWCAFARQTFNSLCVVVLKLFSYNSAVSYYSISCLSCCLSCGCFNSCDRVSDTDRISCCLFSVSCFVTTRCERYCYDSCCHQN